MTVDAFALLVPVKSLPLAKTRLALDTRDTRRLMAAFAEDVLGAACRCPSVHRLFVVTDEPELGRGLPMVEVLPDEGAGDLNTAITAAARRVRDGEPALGIAALCADLPCLLPEDLGHALDADAGPRWFVADADGSGTTLLATVPGTELHPMFGPGSAARHAESGAVPVPGRLATLRRDVDTTADLEEAVTLGVGPNTARALALSSSHC
ncbi:MAG TPA: 2-phospho-L-lactate guanylyltransferase [Marmoricola sp.]|nr:2-phospho-L-lactate guanylyltransferase [Marmoricola sp.]